jgi:hypothetical protein
MPRLVLWSHIKVRLLFQKLPDIFLELFLDIRRSPTVTTLARWPIESFCGPIGFVPVHPEQLTDIVSLVAVLDIEVVHIFEQLFDISSCIVDSNQHEFALLPSRKTRHICHLRGSNER